jgi:hypothetical protein
MIDAPVGPVAPVDFKNETDAAALIVPINPVIFTRSLSHGSYLDLLYVFGTLADAIRAYGENKLLPS